MSTYEVYAVVAYFIGVVIKRFVNASAGGTIEVIAAVIFVLVWLIGLLSGKA